MQFKSKIQLQGKVCERFGIIMIAALKTNKHGLIFTQVTIINQHNLTKPIKKKQQQKKPTLNNPSQYKQEKVSEPLWHRFLQKYFKSRDPNQSMNNI